jgi:hypothetical protein
MCISSDLISSLKLKVFFSDCSCVFCVRVDFESQYQERVILLRRRNGMMTETQAAMVSDDRSSMITTVIEATSSAHVSVHYRVYK